MSIQTENSNSSDFQELQSTVTDMMSELANFNHKPTKACGTRLRKLLSDLMKECKSGRAMVLSQVKSIPKRTRVKKEKVQEPDEEIIEEQEVEDEVEVKPKKVKAKAKK